MGELQLEAFLFSGGDGVVVMGQQRKNSGRE